MTMEEKIIIEAKAEQYRRSRQLNWEYQKEIIKLAHKLRMKELKYMAEHNITQYKGIQINLNKD